MKIEVLLGMSRAALSGSSRKLFYLCNNLETFYLAPFSSSLFFK